MCQEEKLKKKKKIEEEIFASCILCNVCSRASVCVFVFGLRGVGRVGGRSRGGGGDDERKLSSLLLRRFDYSSPPLD